jgi:DNA polymerase-3 subunit gamma/tau
MAYTVLARRYRSQSFDDVVGQDAISRTLKNAISSGRVAHAYLFCGTRGVGKTTMARILAKALNCLDSDGPTTTPCCKCDSCLAVNSGDDIDVIEIDGASNNGVDNIRELRQNAIYRPARARHKIYIIDEVHMLSTGAFNALLKILEEPPTHVKFIFATTEPNKVLATIQSRCQRFDFVNISAADIAKQLRFILNEEKIKYEDDLVLMLSRLANGSMRDSLSLLDQLLSTGQQPLSVEMLQEFIGQPNRDTLAQLLSQISSSDAGAVLKTTDSLLNCGQSGVQIIDGLIEIMRDLMVIKAAGAKNELVILTEAERTAFIKLAEDFDIAALVYNITALERLRYTVKNSDNPRAILEATLLRLALSENFIGVDKLIDALNTAGAVSVPSADKKKIELKVAKAGSEPDFEDDSLLPQNSSPSSARQVIDSPVTIEKITQRWADILDAGAELLGNNKTILLKANPVAFDGGTLKLSFAEDMKFQADMLQRPVSLERVVNALSAVLGESVRLKFEYHKAMAGADEQAAKPKGAKLSQSKRDEILSNPAVRTVLTGLNATVTGIESQ